MPSTPEEATPTEWATSISIEYNSNLNGKAVISVRENCNADSTLTEIPANATKDQIAQAIADRVKALLMAEPVPFPGFELDGAYHSPSACQFIVSNRIGKPLSILTTEL